MMNENDGKKDKMKMKKWTVVIVCGSQCRDIQQVLAKTNRTEVPCVAQHYLSGQVATDYSSCSINNNVYRLPQIFSCYVIGWGHNMSRETVLWLISSCSIDKPVGHSPLSFSSSTKAASDRDGDASWTHETWGGQLPWRNIMDFRQRRNKWESFW